MVTYFVIIARQPARFPNSFTIRTSATCVRNPFRIRTYRCRPDLHILNDLQSANFFSKSFIPISYNLSRNCTKQTTYKPVRITTYKKRARNPFRIRTSKSCQGCPEPAVLPSTTHHSLLTTHFCYAIASSCTLKGRIPVLRIHSERRRKSVE